MKLISAVLLVLSVPTMAAAQSGGFFIQGGALADVLFSPSVDASARTSDALTSSGATYQWIDLNGDRRFQPGEQGPLVSSALSLRFPDVQQSRSRMKPGALVALGTFIAPSVSVRVEASFQGDHVSEANSGDIGPVVRLENRHVSSTIDVFVAAGWHQGQSRRASITYLGGMVFRRQRDESVLRYVIPEPLLPPQLGLGGTIVTPAGLPNEQFGATTYAAGVMAGIDVTIGLSQHLALVPQVRMVAVNQTWNLRPGIAMRWRP